MPRVDYQGNQHDFMCAYMASLGASDHWIAEETGLTKGQAGYRARMAGVKRWDARHGRTDLARAVMRTRIFNESREHDMAVSADTAADKAREVARAKRRKARA